MTTTAATDVSEFLLARIAEDESVARAARDFTSDNRWTWAVLDFITESNAAHGRRHAPRRVLAECEAKRRIVALHPRHDWLPPGRDECAECGCADDGSVEWPCPTLRALALPYADHADYREEWRP